MCPPKSKSSTAKPKTKNWDDLCGVETVTGDKKKLSVILDGYGTTGTTARTTIFDMVKKAESLDLQDAPSTTRGRSTGISFHIAQYTGTTSKALKIKSEFVNSKIGASSCYENTLFTKDLILEIEGKNSDILIHQSVAPCTRCRSGYRSLAKDCLRTIVVSCDKGYDQTGDDAVFIFSPAGDVTYAED